MKFMVKAAALTVILIKDTSILSTRYAISSNISNLAAGYGCFGANGRINAEVGKLISQLMKFATKAAVLPVILIKNTSLLSTRYAYSQQYQQSSGRLWLFWGKW